MDESQAYVSYMIHGSKNKESQAYVFYMWQLHLGFMI